MSKKPDGVTITIKKEAHRQLSIAGDKLGKSHSKTILLLAKNPTGLVGLCDAAMEAYSLLIEKPHLENDEIECLQKLYNEIEKVKE